MDGVRGRIHFDPGCVRSKKLADRLAPIILHALGLAVGCALSFGAASAQTSDQFYGSHTLTLGASSGPGGSYDAYMRLLARHIGRHIPGSPAIVVQDVPAGGGMELANRLFNTAPNDGSYVGVLHGSVLNEHIFKDPIVHFDGARFAWVGNMMSESDSCVISVRSNIKTVEDFLTRKVILGATGFGAQSYSFPIIYNRVLSTKFKVIPGYPGTPERVLAMERGELDGSCGITTTSFGSVLFQKAKEGKVIMIAQAALQKDPRYPEVPNLLEFAKTPADRRALEFTFAPLQLGRPIAAPPGIPLDRIALLRRAFDETLKDPEFLADAEKLKMDIMPLDAATVAAKVHQLYETPKEVVERIASILKGT